MTDTESGSVPVAVFSVAVSPDGTSDPVRQTSNSFTTSFSIQNTGATDNFTVTCHTTASLSCTAPTSPTTINSGVTKPITLTYQTSATTGPGQVVLKAVGTYGAADTGYVLVTVQNYGVAVTPDAATDTTRRPYTTYTRVFQLQSTATVTDTFSLACAGGGGATCAILSPTGKQVLTAAGTGATATATATVQYTTSATGANDSLTLTATSAHASDVGSLIIPIGSGAAPVITLVVPTGTTRAVVNNRQPPILARFTNPGTGNDTTLTQLLWNGEDVTLLAQHGRGVLEWEPDSVRRLGVGGIGDSAQVSVRACTTSSACSTVTRWVVLLRDNKPILGFQTMARNATTAGYSGSFGPTMTVSGTDLETGFATPAYVSMGANRSAALVYSTRTSYPRALIPFEVELPWPAGTADQLVVVLRDGTTALDSLVVATPSCLTGTLHQCRTVLQGDFSNGSYSTPTRKWLKVEARVTSAGTTLAATDSVEVVLVDRRLPWYGSGWWPVAASQLVQAGEDRLLIAANGAAVVYRGNGDSLYISGPGNTIGLTRLPSDTITTFALRARGSTAYTTFDARGRARRMIDQSGNVDSLHYAAASTMQVGSQVDRTGHAITFAYDANGKLKSMTDPGGRVTGVKVNPTTNQLERDSVPSPTATPLTTAYNYVVYSGTGTSTALLGSMAGVLGDTTYVTYGTNFPRRPIWVDLPRVPNDSGAMVQPRLLYQAAESQGFHVLIGQDKAIVQLTDALGHWTRTQPNRWGESRTTWDQIGTISQSVYTPDGRQLWSQGKNGDSSRVYTDYDGSRRILRTRIVRGPSDTFITDSLAYDASHRVVWSRTGQGAVTTVSYDTFGRPIHTTGSEGVRNAWYAANGLPDSTTLNDQISRVTYDATWKNVATVIDEAGQIQAVNRYDGVGRDTTSDAKIQVQLNALLQPVVQWRRARTVYNVLNQPTLTQTAIAKDSTRIQFDSSFADTLRYRQTSYTYDVAGRLVARLNERGKAMTYVLDRLGRVLARRPWSDSVAVKDSMVYDVAGNVRTTITRRGFVLTSTYDTRNRELTAVIPTVGTRNTQYGGPRDQVTRIWYTNPIDSIGINSEVRYGYDSRGRLRADTAYSGTIARVNTFGYDTTEQLASRTNALGTWTYTYQLGRPQLIARLTMPTSYADTAFYTYDPSQRPGEIALHHAGTLVSDWSAGYYASGSPVSYGAYLYDSAASIRFSALAFSRPLGVDNLDHVLAPYWSWEEGYGGGRDSIVERDSYDGWGRSVGVQTTSYRPDGHAQTLTDSLLFDRRGNLLPGTFDATTDRLTAITIGPTTYATYTYDRDGNQITSVKGGVTLNYSYDALNRLVAVTQGITVIARYGYDVLGRRIAKAVYSTATGGTLGYLRMIYSGDRVEFETDSAGTLGMQYEWGTGTDKLLSFRTPGSPGVDWLVATDLLGSVRSVSRKDGTNTNTVPTVLYGPYGGTKSGTFLPMPAGLRYGWTGREFDEETGWYFNRARYYDPYEGRFVQEDPIGYDGGDNLYAYVEGHVLEASDPTGTQCADVPISYNGTPLGDTPVCNGSGGGLGGGLSFANDDGHFGIGLCLGGNCTSGNFDRLNPIVYGSTQSNDGRPPIIEVRILPGDADTQGCPNYIPLASSTVFAFPTSTSSWFDFEVGELNADLFGGKTFSSPISGKTRVYSTSNPPYKATLQTSGTGNPFGQVIQGAMIGTINCSDGSGVFRMFPGLTIQQIN